MWTRRVLVRVTSSGQSPSTPVALVRLLSKLLVLKLMISGLIVIARIDCGRNARQTVAAARPRPAGVRASGAGPEDRARPDARAVRRGLRPALGLSEPGRAREAEHHLRHHRADGRRA